jgi:hypothetical protein
MNSKCPPPPEPKMNTLFEKISQLRYKIGEARLQMKELPTVDGKKSDYFFFSINDFLPLVTKFEREIGLLSVFSMIPPDQVVLDIFDSETGTNETIKFKMEASQFSGYTPSMNFEQSILILKRIAYTSYLNLTCPSETIQRRAFGCSVEATPPVAPPAPPPITPTPPAPPPAAPTEVKPQEKEAEATQDPTDLKDLDPIKYIGHYATLFGHPEVFETSTSATSQKRNDIYRINVIVEKEETDPVDFKTTIPLYCYAPQIPPKNERFKIVRSSLWKNRLTLQEFSLA